MTHNLLRKGFLTRGAVVLGNLYHEHNAIFGPALLQAVTLEEREAFYPRILVDQAVVRLLDQEEGTGTKMMMIEDQTGRMVVNPFPKIIGVADPVVFQAFVDLNFHFPEVSPLISGQIEALEQAQRHQHAEKWRYFRQLIEGPVLAVAPELRPFWERASCKDG